MKKIFTLLMLLSLFTSQAQITDIDGNSYDTVRIGDQTWMAENLNVSRFRNGDTIQEAKSDEEWENALEIKQPAWCYIENNQANITKYGKLYNWYAVNDPRGIAPSGWQIPSDEAWTILTDFLGGNELAGVKMKSNSGWLNDGNGTNSSGFSALPGGNRSIGFFYALGEVGFWWSSTEDGPDYAWSRCLSWYKGNLTRKNYWKVLGLSVRCIKD
jgi:uncharacterized protein (TIGR02145 family)